MHKHIYKIFSTPETETPTKLETGRRDYIHSIFFYCSTNTTFIARVSQECLLNENKEFKL